MIKNQTVRELAEVCEEVAELLREACIKGDLAECDRIELDLRKAEDVLQGILFELRNPLDES